MVDERTAFLIQRVLDREATPEERAALDALAAKDAAVRAAHDDLATTVALLAQVETVAPPPDLKRRIMRALPAERYARVERRTPASVINALRTVLRESLSARPAFALAYTMVLGVVVGAAAFAVISDTGLSPAPSEAYGTMAPPEAAALPRPTEEHVIDLDEVEGTVRLRAEGERVLFELELAPQTETEVQVTFDPDRLQWQGLARIDGRPSGAATVHEGEVLLTLSGPAHYRLSFDAGDRPSPLTLSMAQGGATVYRRTVSISRLAGG